MRRNKLHKLTLKDIKILIEIETHIIHLFIFITFFTLHLHLLPIFSEIATPA